MTKFSCPYHELCAEHHYDEFPLLAWRDRRSDAKVLASFGSQRAAFFEQRPYFDPARTGLWSVAALGALAGLVQHFVLAQTPLTSRPGLTAL